MNGHDDNNSDYEAEQSTLYYDAVSYDQDAQAFGRRIERKTAEKQTVTHNKLLEARIRITELEREKINDLQLSLLYAQGNNIFLNQEKEACERKLQEYSVTIEELNCHNRDLKEIIGKQQQAYKELQTENHDKVETITAMTASNILLEKSVQTMQEQLITLKNELENANQQRNVDNQKLQEASLKIEELERERELTLKKLDGLNEQLTEAISCNEAAEVETLQQKLDLRESSLKAKCKVIHTIIATLEDEKSEADTPCNNADLEQRKSQEGKARKRKLQEASLRSEELEQEDIKLTDELKWNMIMVKDSHGFRKVHLCEYHGCDDPGRNRDSSKTRWLCNRHGKSKTACWSPNCYLGSRQIGKYYCLVHDDVVPRWKKNPSSTAVKHRGQKSVEA